MQTTTITGLLLLLCFFVQSQNLPSNSFKIQYSKTFPSLQYEYDSLNQLHDYSGNWDLDGDDKNDKLCFVGTGGAHLYYSLRIVLSSDSIERNYSFIQTGFPFLLPTPISKNADLVNQFIPFAVFDYDTSKGKDVFIRLDQQSFQANKKLLRKSGVNSQFIVIAFHNSLPVFTDLHPTHDDSKR